MSFKLKKTSIITGQDSMVEEGRVVTGKLYTKGITDEDPLEVTNLDDIKIGSPILVLRTYYDFIRTSTIQKILKNEDGSLELTTETSIYTLREVS